MSEEREQQTTDTTDRRPPPGLTNGAADDDSDEASSPPPSWREDWRTALSQGDEKRAKALERFSTPENLAKAFFDTRERSAVVLPHPSRPRRPPRSSSKRGARHKGFPTIREATASSSPKR
jgi:hypothetical protein